jgi:hypothetical protein
MASNSGALLHDETMGTECRCIAGIWTRNARMVGDFDPLRLGTLAICARYADEMSVRTFMSNLNAHCAPGHSPVATSPFSWLQAGIPSIAHACQRRPCSRLDPCISTVPASLRTRGWDVLRTPVGQHRDAPAPMKLSESSPPHRLIELASTFFLVNLGG